MIASSTSKPREIISAPKETLCKPIPSSFIIIKVIAITKGILMATIRPGFMSKLSGFLLIPRLIRLAIKTMEIASNNTTRNSSTVFETALG